LAESSCILDLIEATVCHNLVSGCQFNGDKVCCEKELIYPVNAELFESPPFSVSPFFKTSNQNPPDIFYIPTLVINKARLVPL